jgi:hypothetical protein
MAYLQPLIYSLVVHDIYYDRFVRQSQRRYDNVLIWTWELEKRLPIPGVDLQWV